MPRNNDPVGEQIRAWVAERVKPRGPLEQKDLAELSGQKLFRVHRYVTGQLRIVPLSFLDAVLRVLGTDLVKALQGVPVVAKPPAPALSSHQRAVVREMTRMSDSQQKLLVLMARGLTGRGRQQVR